MLIHVVQQGETIDSIADSYGISVTMLIRDNELSIEDNLVVGQSLVIAFPEQTYTVQEGDTLQGIADSHNVSILQLFRNNPFLADREFIYPGETIVIKYNNTKGQVTIHGNAFPFINITTLRKTLPYLTYLSIINYIAVANGEINVFYDDTEIIKVTKNFGVMPLMFLSTFTLKGEANVGIAYELLLSDEYQTRQIENILNILKEKGYYGVNLSLQYITISTIKLYERYLQNVYNRLNQEGYYVFVTISPAVSIVNDEIIIEQINYSVLNQYSHNIIFLSYNWATNVNAPSPISSQYYINIFLDFISNIIPSDKIVSGIPTTGYDWQLPYVYGVSNIYSLTVDSVITLARNVGAIIQFDETSQTPFFTYDISSGVNQIQHIVWFIDVRSINSLLNLVSQYNLLGSGIWNIMDYNTNLWLVINTQYEITKII
jgi:spore germination protein